MLSVIKDGDKVIATLDQDETKKEHPMKAFSQFISSIS
jgi:hypothetical protein